MQMLFEFPSQEKLFSAIDEVRAQIDRAGYAIIRGIVTQQEVDAVRKKVAELHQPDKDIRVSGEYRRGSPDFRRLDLGEYPSSSRFARYFFFFPWNNGDSFRSINDLQMNLFNRLARKPDTFGSTRLADTNPDRFRVSFVLQYPIGGGFMSKHRETTGQEEGDKAYVVYLALTSRGKEFQTGGAYIYNGDEKADIEADVRAGDLVVYRGDRYHGVANIDSDQSPNLKDVCGRMMLTTVVKYFPR